MWIITSRLRNNRIVTRITAALKVDRAFVSYVLGCLSLGGVVALSDSLVALLSLPACLAFYASGYTTGHKVGYLDGYSDAPYLSIVLPVQYGNAR